jgi:hypothetical protein
VLYETGIVIELIFFLTGLSYKNRQELIVRTAEREKLKMENERKRTRQTNRDSPGAKRRTQSYFC